MVLGPDCMARGALSCARLSQLFRNLLIFDFLFLGIIFSMLKLTIKDFGKFSKYTFISAIGGLLIDGFVFFVPVKMVSFIVVFGFLFIWNYFLAKLWIGFSDRDAIMIGMWMGFMTNPIIWFNILPFNNFY